MSRILLFILKLPHLLCVNFPTKIQPPLRIRKWCIPNLREVVAITQILLARGKFRGLENAPHYSISSSRWLMHSACIRRL